MPIMILRMMLDGRSIDVAVFAATFRTKYLVNALNEQAPLV